MSPRAPQRPARNRDAAPPRPGPAASWPVAWPAPALALFLLLVATLLFRATLPWVHGRYWWGIDLARDLPAPAFWLPWAACALALLPPVAGFVTSRLPRPAWAHALLAGLALAALVWLLPERSYVTGDTGLRHGDFANAPHPELLVPQALPADLWLHYHLPRAVAVHTPFGAEAAGRAWGALLALLGACAAFSLARAVARGPAAALAAFAIALFTAQLTLCNGYAKSIVEMNLLVLVAAGALLSLARGGRGVLRLGLAVAGALLLHRSAVALLPAWLAGVALAARADRTAFRRPATGLGALAPLAALAVSGPRAWHTLSTFDMATHRVGGAHGAWLAAAVAPAHLMDALQTLLLVAPLAVLAPALFARRDWARRRETAALLALALPQLALLVFVRPQQGLFRDWDVFVTAGLAVSAFVAWLAAEAIDGTPGAGWFALPLALAAAVPSVQWLAHQTDPPRALARADDVLAGPPTRPFDERAAGFDHLGMMWFGRGDYARADAALGRSIVAAPNPRVYVEWGMNATMLGRPADALTRYLRAVQLNPNLTLGWKGVAASASALGDLPRMELALSALQRLAPDDPTTRDVADYLQRNRPTGR